MLGQYTRSAFARCGRKLSTLAALLALAGCGSDGKVPLGDAALDVPDAPDAEPDGGTPCGADVDCDDGLFCTGFERCRPEDPEADGLGCLGAAAPPCLAGQSCEESSRDCNSEGCGSPDRDGDGHAAVDCGGDDCDDTDPNRYPGNAEFCDGSDHDEDCDANTYGVRDLDGDGEPDALCCNPGADDVLTCGTDCDDNRAGVNPSVPEVCDGRDNDCDGLVDEGVRNTYWTDADGDGHGSDAADAESMSGCFAPEGFSDRQGDCDDSSSGVHPGQVEICDELGVDEDCDGEANPASLCTCTAPDDRGCAAGGRCAAGIEVCDGLTGEWGACSIAPTVEECNTIDDDCDGSTDEAVTVTCYADGDGDTFAAGGAVSSEQCPVTGRGDVGGCPGSFTNRAPFGDNDDCDDANPDRRPSAPDICNGVDDDCDGMTDEGVSVGCYPDADSDTYAPLGAPLSAQCPVAGRGFVGGCPLNFTNRSPVDGADCNDAPGAGASIHPGVEEVCDPGGVDENCDGLANPPADCDCIVDENRGCTAPGVCAAGTETCRADGTWGTCSIAPTTELCDAQDNDCNGVADELFACVQGSDPIACTTTCGSRGVEACELSCTLDTCRGDEVCNGCDDDVDGAMDEGFTCVQGEPGIPCTTLCGTAGAGNCTTRCGLPSALNCEAAAETCNYCDDDGDGTTDDEVFVAVLNSTPPPPWCDDLTLSNTEACSSGNARLMSRLETGSAVGSAWVTESFTMGYGDFVADFDYRLIAPSAANPGRGWAVTLATNAPGQLLGPASEMGAEHNRTGITVQHQFHGVGGTDLRRDVIFIKRLNGDGTTTALHQCLVFQEYLILDQGEVADGILRVVYTPANTVLGQEASIEVLATDGGGTPTDSICSFTGGLLPEIPAGTNVWVGASAGSVSGTAKATVQWRAHNEEISTNGLCE